MTRTPDDPRDLVELTVAGRIYRGWTRVDVQIGLDNAAGSFALELSEREPGDGRGPEPAPWVAQAGAAAMVAIGGEPVLTGWIDAVEPQLTGDSHSIGVRGRSKAADLIDCSAVHPGGAFVGRTIHQIASALAAPFGIDVALRGPAGAPFPRFVIQPGESVFEVLERAAKLRGLLIVSEPDGGVALISPQPIGPAIRIEQGVDLLGLSARHDVTQRFSTYTVKGQSAGDDDTNGRAASQVSGGATDPGVTRHRPLVVIGEDQVTPSSARTRAQWEASVRAAKSQGAEVTMQGWRTIVGALWKVAQQIELIAPAGFVEGQMMVASIGFKLDDSGSTTVLGLAYPDAYKPEPVPASAEAARIRGGRA